MAPKYALAPEFAAQKGFTLPVESTRAPADRCSAPLAAAGLPLE